MNQQDKEKILTEIFKNDPLDILEVKSKPVNLTPDDRLISSFQEINEFITKNGKEPEANINNVLEFQLHTRLKGIKSDLEKVKSLKGIDIHNLLPDTHEVVKESGTQYKKSDDIETIEDIFFRDSLNILDEDDQGLFNFKHVPSGSERENADFVARRKPCKDFSKFEDNFKKVQKELAESKRKLIPFKHKDLISGAFYVHNGILLYLESVEYEEGVQKFKSGARVRVDGRTRTIFENGTESRMLYRSLYKAILSNGYSVTDNIEKINEQFLENFSEITEEDVEAGYIYVVKSKSIDPNISFIKNLFKIGFSTIDINKRIKNASKEPTFLMADVEYIAGWKCYNMNTQKFEQLIHNFFGSSCLNIDVFDENNKRFTPREWFIAPLNVIEQAIELVINGKIVKYKYDPENMTIIRRSNSNS